MIPNEQVVPPTTSVQPQRQGRRGRLPAAPQRTTPGSVFPDVDRALKDCLGRRRFGQKEMSKVLEMLQMVEPECIFCRSPGIQRWDHLVAIRQGGETVLGNMVPSCARCDDSKRELDYDQWMISDARNSPKSRRIADVAERLQRIKEFVRQSKYEVTPVEERLDATERERLAGIRARFQDLRQEVEALIRDYGARTIGR